MSSPAAGSAAFLADAARLGWVGDINMDAVGDAKLLQLGNTVCDGFGVYDQTYGKQVDVFVNSEHFTQTQAATLIASAVRNLCPQYQNRVP